MLCRFLIESSELWRWWKQKSRVSQRFSSLVLCVSTRPPKCFNNLICHCLLRLAAAKLLQSQKSSNKKALVWYENINNFKYQAPQKTHFTWNGEENDLTVVNTRHLPVRSRLMFPQKARSHSPWVTFGFGDAKRGEIWGEDTSSPLVSPWVKGSTRANERREQRSASSRLFKSVMGALPAAAAAAHSRLMWQADAELESSPQTCQTHSSCRLSLTGACFQLRSPTRLTWSLRE